MKPAKISFSSSHLILLAPYFSKKTVVIRRELLHVSRYHLLIPTRTLCLFFSFNRPVFPNLLFISTPFKESLYIYIFSNCTPQTHDILIPQIYHISVHVQHEYLRFIHIKSKNQFSPQLRMFAMGEPSMLPSPPRCTRSHALSPP